mgnify:CR=1 FL=1
MRVAFHSPPCYTHKIMCLRPTVYGNVPELGYYYTYLTIGTPGQTVSGILDTGSTLPAFPCSGCTRCGPSKVRARACNDAPAILPLLVLNPTCTTDWHVQARTIIYLVHVRLLRRPVLLRS